MSSGHLKVDRQVRLFVIAPAIAVVAALLLSINWHAVLKPAGDRDSKPAGPSITVEEQPNPVLLAELVGGTLAEVRNEIGRPGVGNSLAPDMETRVVGYPNESLKVEDFDPGYLVVTGFCLSFGFKYLTLGVALPDSLSPSENYLGDMQQKYCPEGTSSGFLRD